MYRGFQGAVRQGVEGWLDIGGCAGSLGHTGTEGTLEQADDSWCSDEGGTQVSVYRVSSWRIMRGG